MKLLISSKSFKDTFIDYSASAMALWSILCVFTLSIGDSLRLFYNVLYFIGDSALLLAPVWLLPRRLRWLSAVPVWLTSVYLAASSMYFRYWGDLLPLSSVFEPDNWNSFVFGSISHLLAWSDVVMCVLSLGLLVFLLWRRRKYAPANLSWKWRSAGFAASVLIWVMAEICSFYHMSGYLASIEKDNSVGEIFNYRFGDEYAYSRMHDLSLAWKSGYVYFMVNNIKSLSDTQERLVLDENDKESLSRALRSLGGIDNSGRYVSNRDKNLILIIVESLNSGVLTDYGQRLAPELCSLMEKPGTISCLRIYDQVKSGCSSDGQLIYNTGLLPLESGCLAQQFAGNSFPSLAKSLRPRPSMECIVEDGRVWNHKETTLAYGYDALYDAGEIRRLGIDPIEVGGDRAVFEMALQKIDSLPEPFFAQVVTLSMHFPFQDPGIDRLAWIDRITGISPSERNYLQSVAYFDRQLGWFLGMLKAKGIYDRSVIVIASDHDRPYKSVDGIIDSTESLPIAFIALNTGGATRLIDKDAWQMDVYPTILDIMGVTGTDYRGLGTSLVNPDDSLPGTGIPVEEIAGISEKIIRSDFFR